MLRASGRELETRGRTPGPAPTARPRPRRSAPPPPPGPVAGPRGHPSPAGRFCKRRVPPPAVLPHRPQPDAAGVKVHGSPAPTHRYGSSMRTGDRKG
ncbi:uncharacterized protein [Equus caballus]|uniref:uncharacterized protein n=1 Tax=Equus caballus TaxID=9796 RepID=UPI0038B2CBA6